MDESRVQQIRERAKSRSGYPSGFLMKDLDYLLAEVDRLTADNYRLLLAYHHLIVNNARREST